MQGLVEFLTSRNSVFWFSLIAMTVSFANLFISRRNTRASETLQSLQTREQFQLNLNAAKVTLANAKLNLIRVQALVKRRKSNAYTHTPEIDSNLAKLETENSEIETNLGRIDESLQILQTKYEVFTEKTSVAEIHNRIAQLHGFNAPLQNSLNSLVASARLLEDDQGLADEGNN